ncbi:uncharacterized protein LOC116212283 [Punica granatum]|uniref:RRM domain-containing protein n=2 Tax=Punica granatum TaxID=22663 RepID=A0A218WTT2_PUNGR|nr:uncharacterized protein LOC116212283 [Punica granatum]OWM76264.1 hypothetical protein CDL15_Pgr009910 [Punica granatum]PKI71423.1 hypothetical protein CRG98_008202 [Punica granatum]
MNALNLTVRVLNLSPRASQPDVETLFSYCGNVEKIKLQKNEDDSQSALVTFGQPFAYRTALLLNDVPVAGQPIRVLPSEDSSDHPISQGNLSNDTKEDRVKESPTLLSGQQIQASSASHRAKVMSKTRSEISAAAKRTANICAVIITYAPLVTAAFLLSRALHYLAKRVLDVWIKRGNHPIFA